uniref:Uncharacterized protein n=1 Tax=Panagrolaimus sp. ES5 TaxID=591445 RepID=A0AC34FJA2_9BILA
MEHTYEKTVIKPAHPAPTTTMHEKNTVVHTEKPATGEIDNLAAEQQAAGGILESVKAAAMAGVETVKDGKAGEGIKEAAVNFKEDVKDGAHALKDTAKDALEDVKIEANRMTQPEPNR